MNKCSVPARYVTAPHFVADFVVENVLLNLVEFFGEHLVLVIAPTGQTNLHPILGAALLVRDHSGPNVSMADKWTLNFYKRTVEILQKPTR